MAVDLGALEFGDAIEVVGGKIKAVVSVETRRRSGGRPDKYVLITVSKPKHSGDEATAVYESFTHEGISLELGGDNVVRILKNKNQWTDDDMKEAFDFRPEWHEDPIEFENWLEQYKAGRNG